LRISRHGSAWSAAMTIAGAGNPLNRRGGRSGALAHDWD
jgi:hypothetical protein